MAGGCDNRRRPRSELRGPRLCGGCPREHRQCTAIIVTGPASRQARVRTGRLELPRACAPSIAGALRLPVPPRPPRTPACRRPLAWSDAARQALVAAGDVTIAGESTRGVIDLLRGVPLHRTSGMRQPPPVDSAATLSIPLRTVGDLPGGPLPATRPGDDSRPRRSCDSAGADRRLQPRAAASVSAPRIASRYSAGPTTSASSPYCSTVRTSQAGSATWYTTTTDPSSSRAAPG